jgi:regulator of RNase E activity RraA
MAVAIKPGFRIVKSWERAAPEIVEQFRGLAAANISDVQGRQNTLHASVKPVYHPMRYLCGTALTVKARPGDNLLATKAIHMAQPGDVIVISSEYETSLTVWGGVMAAMAAKKGVAGIVTDGAVRDIAECRAADLPIYSVGVTPVGPTKNGAGQINTTISCGGVIIHPGDIIVGDEDGVVVVYKEEARAVLERTHARMAAEQAWFEQIAAGQSILDVSDDELRALGAEIIE